VHLERSVERALPPSRPGDGFAVELVQLVDGNLALAVEAGALGDGEVCAGTSDDVGVVAEPAALRRERSIGATSGHKPSR
jgi:hypothetical protein